MSRRRVSGLCLHLWGANHGVGHEQAVENTIERVEREMEDLGLTEQLKRFRKYMVCMES